MNINDNLILLLPKIVLYISQVFKASALQPNRRIVVRASLCGSSWNEMIGHDVLDEGVLGISASL